MEQRPTANALYGGTKSELERLVKDASELTGQALDPTKFSDIITAIHAVQENLGITGTTAKEATETIQGSIGMAKASWENWLTALGRDDVDMSSMTDQLLESLGYVAQNVGPSIKQIMSQIIQALPEMLSGAVTTLGPALAELLVGAWNMASQTLGNFGIQLPEINSGQVMQTIQTVIDTLSGIAETIGPIIQTVASAVGQIFTAVGPQIASFAEVMGPAITNFINEAIPPLSSALQAILPALMTIAQTILPPLVSFASALFPIIAQLANVIGGILVSAVQMLSPFIALILDIFTGLAPIIQIVTSILSSIANVIMGALTSALNWLQGPLQIVSGFFDTLGGAIQNAANFIGDLIGRIGEVGDAIANSSFGQFVGGAVSTIGGFLGFAKGGFTTGPYIAGEDPRYPNEAVISFNPAYRAANVRYWERAGHMLGVSGVSSRAATASVATGGATYDFSGMTFAPKVEVRGNASKEDIVAAIKQCEGDFVDFVLDALASRQEAVYA